MAVTLPAQLEEFLGLNMCSLSAWTMAPFLALLALFASVGIRYRGAVFYRYYEKRNTRPTRYCTLTAVPYEALAAFVLLVAPRMVWLKNIFVDAVAEGAWENRDLHSVWSWGLLAYFIGIDVYERVIFKRKILSRYYKLKAQRSLDIVVVDGAQPAAPTEKHTYASPADEEAATAPPQPTTTDAAAPEEPRPTFRARLRKILTVQYPDPTAVNVLSQYHMMAFLKALFAFLFLTHAGLMACSGDAPLSELFDLNRSFVVQFGLVSAWMAVRFVALFVRGVQFGCAEVDFAGVNSREGRLRL